ncbi:PP2C family protein-serine/threonine phosphatase [Candidatus Ferrigenium straubiae]|jgi:hemerythrin-like metal-binding protein|uniref:PP2C family protein-serine/threonine phosphatase n=1 Tax=Candidatus Ferrigenium straubiae TaxID=2919506 RepID=UPI003F4AD659
MAAAHALAWGEQLETGLDSVDSQHRRLIAIINALSSLHEQGAAAEELAAVLAELRDYTVYHFQHEADLMQSLPVNPANREAHLKAHQGFVDLIVRAGEMIATNPRDVTDHLLAFLVKWLVHHITGVDARMAREIFALRSGVAAAQAGLAENPLHDALVDTVSNLYDSIGARTFEILELNRQLQIYHDAQQEENALAQDIILRLMKRGGLSGSQLHYWFVPTATFSGDIIAAIPSPGDRFYALMADATGHGLAAAITVLPVLSTFHAMAEHGHPIGEIVAEINRNLRATLPVDRFVAAALLHIDEAAGTAEVWIGGMPDLLLLNPEGMVVRRMSSQHLPLGIVDSGDGMAATARIAWPAGSQIAMYSDGLIEASSEAGEMFGIERLCKALLAAPADRRVAAVQDAVTAHIGPTAPHDDISLMLIDCKNA